MSVTVQTNRFRDFLEGKDAFYSQSDYKEATQKTLRQSDALPAIYDASTESKAHRIIKEILSYIVFPIAFYRLLQALIGKLGLLPSSSPDLFWYGANYADLQRRTICLTKEWKYKRFSIEVDGYTIDATIMGKPSTLNNKRWVLVTGGNGEFCEDKLQNNHFKYILSSLQGNALVFNYPGVGSSTGLPSKNAMVKAYNAMLQFLEDKEHGIGAEQIIGYGYSIGGGVQGEALKAHKLKEDVKYVFIKNRTFSSLSDEASALMGSSFFGFLIKLFGWELDSVESSRKLSAHEIVLQAANKKEFNAQCMHAQMTDRSHSIQIVGDGIIAARASLAQALLNDPECSMANKTIIASPENHWSPLNSDLICFIAKTVHSKLGSV
ncbi:MAG: hypothetical protein P4L16_04775 [Chlamydiales bacterium]|nr:hypothetical protein [Chlamydiales bacterium]